MEIFLEKENKTITHKLKEKITLIQLLNELNISTNSVILVKNNKIALEDSEIENTDSLKILSVVSGG